MRGVILALLTCVFLGSCESSAQDATKEEQLRKWSQYFRTRVKDYKLHVIKKGERQQLDLIPTPVLSWRNPIRSTTRGECFIWTLDGRVRSIASVFAYPNAKGQRVAHAFNVFGIDTLVAAYDGREFWRVEADDLPAMIRVPDSPTVASSAPLRLSQMRRLARAFTASSGGSEKEEPRVLRLLTSPLYRYTQDATSKVDGALFAFAMGTDPEILLLLESNGEGPGGYWRFAAVRHSFTSLQVLYQGDEVWSYERGTPMPTYLSQHGIDQKPSLLP